MQTLKQLNVRLILLRMTHLSVNPTIYAKKNIKQTLHNNVVVDFSSM